MLELIVICDIDALDALGATYEPGKWPYTPQHLAINRRLNELMLHVTAMSPVGIAKFRVDVGSARIVPSHIVPLSWGNDWEQLVYPNEGRRTDNLTPYEYYQRGIEREQNKQLLREIFLRAQGEKLK